MVISWKSCRWERKLGAPDRLLDADLSSFPGEWDTYGGRLRLSDYAGAILDAASEHSLSVVALPAMGFTRRRVAVTGEEARARLLASLRRQQESKMWELLDASWTDEDGSTVLLTYGEPDGWNPDFIHDWGPQAQAVLEAIETAWARLSREIERDPPTEDSSSP